MSPTIVIIPGAWQLAACYAAFAAQLERSGFATEVVPLPSVGGTSTPLPGFDDDVAAVRSAVSRLGDRDQTVVLLCHSYGGLVGSCAVQGLDVASRRATGKMGGVVLTIFMSAYVIPIGSMLRGVHDHKERPSWMKPEGDRVTTDPAAVIPVLFNDLPVDQVVSDVLPNLSHSTAAVFSAPATYEPWTDGLACAFIHCTNDQALSLPIQEKMAAQLGPDALTYHLTAGHCPFLSVPGEVIRVIKDACDKVTVE